jgi:hypothetical protein
MVQGNMPQRDPGSSFKLLDNRFEIPGLAGTFAFRFKGYAITQQRPFYLLGIGQLTIDRQGSITGEHHSAATAMGGQDATVMDGDYTLSGIMSVASSGAGQAGIFFTKSAGDGKNVAGGFYVQVAGNLDRFWMMSSKAVKLDNPPDHELHEAIELVSLEAVRIATGASLNWA